MKKGGNSEDRDNTDGKRDQGGIVIKEDEERKPVFDFIRLNRRPIFIQYSKRRGPVRTSGISEPAGREEGTGKEVGQDDSN